MAFIPNSNSVVAFQSDPTKLVGTVSIVGSPTQIAGSILAVNFPSPSTISYQLAGSILAVSGSFSATPQNSILAIQIAGSVQAVRTDNASIIAVGNVASGATDSGNPLKAGGVYNITQPTLTDVQRGDLQLTNRGALKVALFLNDSATTFVPRADNADGVAVSATNNNLGVLNRNTLFNGTTWDRTPGTAALGAYVNVTGSVMAVTYQAAGSIMAVSGTFSSTPQGSITALQLAGSIQAVNMPSPSIIAYQAAGSVMAISGNLTANPQGSIVALQLAGSVMAVSGNFSSGNTSVQLLAGNAAIGSVTALQGTNPWLIGNNSVLAFQGTTPWTVNSILGTYQEKNAVTASVFGIPVLFKIDETNSVLTAASPQSPLPIRGSVATLQGTTPWIINVPTPSLLSIQPGGSVLNANISGSVAAAVTNFTASVAANINVISASIITNQGTSPWVIQSIVGTFGDNTAFTNNDKGLGVLGIRNDTVASIINADKQYGQWAMDSAGRNLVIPFAPGEASIIANASVVNGGDSGSVVVFAAAGAGLRNYVTDFEVSNTGSVATLITFTEGGGSIIGRTIAPAGGGSNMPGMNTPMRNQKTNQPINMVTATAASVVYVAAWGYKAP